MNARDNEAAQKEIRKQVDTYKDTLWAVLALIHELCWDESTRTRCSDVVHLHGKEQLADGNAAKVTPDIAMMLPSKQGIIGEVKLPFSQQMRADAVAQLMKYDRVASSWLAKGGRCQGGAVGTVLLTHHSRKVDAEDYLKANAAFKPANPFAIISSAHVSQADEFIALERHYGTLVPASKDARLRKTVSIKLDHIINNYGNVHFCDAEPPLAHLLLVMWDCLFPNLMTEEMFAATSDGDEADESKKHPEIKVTLPTLVEKLRDNFSLRLLDPSLPGKPETRQVEQALDRLIQFGLATKAKQGSYYTIEYRKLRGGTLDYFAKKLVGTKKKGRKTGKGSKRQLALF